LQYASFRVTVLLLKRRFPAEWSKPMIYTAVVETLASQFFAVRETGDASSSHVWLGLEMKRTKAGFVPKAKARELLVRKLGTRVVASLA
jgi:hypothetical protein